MPPKARRQNSKSSATPSLTAPPAPRRILDTLAPEILHNIFNRLGTESVGQMRLVSRHLKDVATEHLLPEITVYMTTSSCHRLSQAALYPHIIVHTKTLWIEPYRVREPELYHSANAEKLWLDHQAVCNDQEKAQAAQLLLTSTQALFQACPNISAVKLSTDHQLRVSNIRHSKYFKPVYTCLFQPLGLLSGGSNLTYPLTAAHDAGRPVTSLAAAPISRYFLEQGRKTTAKLIAVFGGLEDVHLQFRHTGSEPDASDDEAFDAAIKRGSLARMLAAAGNLRSLKLDFPLDENRHSIVQLADIIEQNSWPELVSLSLRGVVVTGDNVHVLVDRLPSLRSLVVRHSEPSEEVWQHFLREEVGGWRVVDVLKGYDASGDTFYQVEVVRGSGLTSAWTQKIEDNEE